MAQTGKSNLSGKKYLAGGVGLCALDYISIVGKFPGPDEKLDALHFSCQGGGPVPTALCALGHFGEKTSFIGKCGNDSEGKLIVAELKRFAVDTGGMVLDTYSRTPRAFIWVESETGARTVVLDRTEIADLAPEELSMDILSSCQFLLIDGRESKASLKAAHTAAKNGAQIILDVGSQRENIRELLPVVDYLVVSRKFAEPFAKETDPGKAAMKLLALGFKAVVVTLGEDGAVCAAEGEFFYQQAFKVDVVDTTGAGDVFHGAFIYGLSKDWELPAIIEFSCAAASLKCRRIGGRQGLPSVDEVIQFIEESKGKL
jgi:sulfofructose kinase